MFKGFQDTSKSKQFNGFPTLNHQMNNSAYGYSGVTNWMDAASGLATQINLDPVTSWKDKIQSLEFVQSTAGNQPRLVLADASFNNKPTIDFFSNTRRLQTARGGIVTGNQLSIAIVAKVDTRNSNSNDVLSDSGLVANRITFGGNSAPQVGIGVYNNSTGVAQISSTVEDILPHIVLLTNTRLIIDGVVISTAGNWSPQTIYDQIGISGTLTGNTFFGRIAEIVVWGNRSLSSEECLNVSASLNAKYAIY